MKRVKREGEKWNKTLYDQTSYSPFIDGEWHLKEEFEYPEEIPLEPARQPVSFPS